MQFFAKIFDTFASWSSKLPSANLGAYYVVALLLIALVGIIIGLTYFRSSAYKLRKACKKISMYLEGESVINDDNVADFTNVCFGSSAPRSLRDTWVEYLGVRFGYPSDIISESDVYDKETKNVKRGGGIRANLFAGISLIALALFTFWGMGSMGGAQIGVIICLGLILVGVGYIVLVVLGKKNYEKARDAFYDMQDDLDSKVNLQVEKDYAIDASPLMDIAAVLGEIIARNTARPEPSLKAIMDEEEKASETPSADEDERMIGFEEDSEKQDDAVAEAVAGAQDMQNAYAADKQVQETPIDDLIAEQSALPGNEDADNGEANGASEIGADTEIEGIAAEEGLTEQSAEESAIAKSAPEIDEQSTFFRKKALFTGEDSIDPQSGETTDDGLQEDAGDDNGEIIEGFDERTQEINKFEEEEDDMFGRKKKQKQEIEYEAVAFDGLYVEAELMEDDEADAPVAAAAQPAPAPAPVAAQPAAPAQAAPAQSAPAATYAPAAQAQPAEEKKSEIPANATKVEEIVLDDGNIQEIIYVEDSIDDSSDDSVKAPRLAKLPLLVDYVITLDLSRATKMKVAMLLLQAYNVFKNSPENRAIAVQCLGKLLADMKKR